MLRGADAPQGHALEVRDDGDQQGAWGGKDTERDPAPPTFATGGLFIGGLRSETGGMSQVTLTAIRALCLALLALCVAASAGAAQDGADADLVTPRSWKKRSSESGTWPPGYGEDSLVTPKDWRRHRGTRTHWRGDSDIVTPRDWSRRRR